MQLQDFLAIGGIVATLIVGIISWFVSAYLTKKSQQKKILTYEMKKYHIISTDFLKKSNDIKVYYKDDILPEPTLLAVDIINSGNIAINNPPIEIDAVGATCIIPGYIEDIEPGYEDLWSLERTNAESCAIKLAHINPAQVVKARFFLDEFPTEMPIFKCPMENLKIRKVDTELKRVLLESVWQVALGILPFKIFRS